MTHLNKLLKALRAIKKLPHATYCMSFGYKDRMQHCNCYVKLAKDALEVKK